jgi:putative ABC transport system substrate-binding protein
MLLSRHTRRREFIAGLGSAGTWSLVAHAQNAASPRLVAVVMSTDGSDPQERSSINGVVTALAKLGWVSGQNVELRYWWGNGDSSRMIANARDAVATRPDVMLVKGANLPAVHDATTTIPVVFVVLSDAIAEGYVGSFARPNSNITGFSSDERALVGKRLTLLREIAPRTTSVLYVRSRRVGADTDSLFKSLLKDAEPLGLSVADGAADNDKEIEEKVQRFTRDSGGGIIAAFDAFVTVHRDKLIELAARYRLPAVYPLPAFIQSGGLMSYGFDQDDQFRQAANYVARILAGEKPSDLPVQTPTKFKMVINVRTAKLLGLAVPSSLIATADDMVE